MVAFAISRAVGSSVVRNRLRRQLRVLLTQAELPSGSFLVGVRPAGAARSFRELSSDVDALVSQIRRVSAQVSTHLPNTSSKKNSNVGTSSSDS
jgi:ribonuclease P protein component